MREVTLEANDIKMLGLTLTAIEIKKDISKEML